MKWKHTTTMVQMAREMFEEMPPSKQAEEVFIGMIGVPRKAITTVLLGGYGAVMDIASAMRSRNQSAANKL